MQIRVAGENDAAVLMEIYSYYVEKTAVTFEYETPSVEEFAGRIRDMQKRTERSWGMPMVLPFIRGVPMDGVPRCPFM